MFSLFLAASSYASAEPVTAERALEIHREVVKPAENVTCGPGEGEEIVVCGERGPDPYRLPLPVVRDPGARSTLPGEVARAPTSVGDCLRLCPQPLRVDLIKTVPKVIEGIRKIFDPDR